MSTQEQDQAQAQAPSKLVRHPSSQLEIDMVLPNVRQPAFSMQDPVFFSTIFGQGKRRYPHRKNSAIENMLVCGEDVVVRLTDLAVCPALDSSVKYTAVADGHGLYGDLASTGTIKELQILLQARINEMVQALLNDNTDGFNCIWDEIFAGLELHHQHDIKVGGTTLTVNLFIKLPTKTLIATANVGDSESLIINNKTGEVEIMTESHSWDDPQQRTQYLTHCASLGKTPCEVVFSRFHLHLAQAPRDLDGSLYNRGKPIPIFKKGTAELDHESIRNFTEFIARRFPASVGGSQGLRKDLLVEKSDPEFKVVTVHPDFAHLNWGSCPVYINEIGQPQGGAQMWKSIGDTEMKQKTHMDIRPSKKIRVVGEGEDLSVLCCSDGLADTRFLSRMAEEAVEHFRENKTVDELGAFWLDRSMTIAQLQNYGGVDIVESKRVPKWDDVSGSLVRIVGNKGESSEVVSKGTP